MSSRYPVTRLPVGVDIDTLKNILLHRIAKDTKRLDDLQDKYARKTKRSPASSRYPIKRIDEEVNEEGWNLGSKKSKKSKKSQKSKKSKKTKKTKKSRGKRSLKRSA